MHTQVAQSSEDLSDVFQSFFSDVFEWSAFGAVIVVALAAIFVIWLIGKLATLILNAVIDKTEVVKNNKKLMRYRRAETVINVTAAVLKITVVSLAFFLAWRLLIPNSAPAAVVGASALFVVLAGATVAPLLKDITAGSVMLAERWYGVGDYLTVEPFPNTQGVVEQVSLRSTKLRGLGGEVIWIHNQHIQAVKVKYRGMSTIALDVFVKDKDKALSLLQGIADIVPKGPMMVLNGLEITEVEQLNGAMWRIELIGQTVPGREWLIESFALEAIKDADEQLEDTHKVIVYGPIARYVDATAEKRFKRAIRQPSPTKQK